VNLLETPLNQVSKEEPITVTTKMVIPIKVASKRSDNYLEGNRRRFDVYLLYLMDLLAKVSSAIRAPNRHPFSIRFTSPTGFALIIDAYNHYKEAINLLENGIEYTTTLIYLHILAFIILPDFVTPFLR
jgi:hypothetical protein